MKKLIFIVIFTMIMVVDVNAYNLSSQQKYWIKKYSHMYIGKSKQWVKVMEAIRKTECNKFMCGKSLKKGDNSFGNWQIQVNTAKDMMVYLGVKQDMSDKEVVNMLMYNDKFATQVAVRYFAYLWNKFNTLDLAIVSYNFGPANTIKYIRRGYTFPNSVNKYLDIVKRRMYDRDN